MGAKIELKEVQKSSTEALRSSKDDLKIKKRKCSPNHRKTNGHRRFFEIRRQVGSSDLHRKGSWDQMLRLWWCHFEALELPEAPRGYQESPKKLSKRPQVTMDRPCRRFRASERGTSALEIRLGRVRPAPRTRSRTRFLIINIFIHSKTRSRRRCSLLTGGSADYLVGWLVGVLHVRACV